MTRPTLSAHDAARGSERMRAAGAIRRARTRAAILDALDRHLRTRAFDAISVVELAEDAGVSVGSVYGHFGNKVRLVLALALERVEGLVIEVAARPRAEAPLDRALAFGDFLVASADLTPAAVHLVCHPRDAYGDLIAASDPSAPIARHVLALFARFEHDLDEAERSGALPEGDTAASIGAALMATWLGLLQSAAPGSVVGTPATSVARNWAALRRALTISPQ